MSDLKTIVVFPYIVINPLDMNAYRNVRKHGNEAEMREKVSETSSHTTTGTISMLSRPTEKVEVGYSGCDGEANVDQAETVHEDHDPLFGSPQLVLADELGGHGQDKYFADTVHDCDYGPTCYVGITDGIGAGNKGVFRSAACRAEQDTEDAIEDRNAVCNTKDYVFLLRSGVSTGSLQQRDMYIHTGRCLLQRYGA